MKLILHIFYFFLVLLISQKEVLSATISFNCGDTNCAVCTLQLQILNCIQCEIGYQLQNGKCQLSNCTTSQGQYLANQFDSSCKICHPACKNCASGTYHECTECNQGYYGILSPKRRFLQTCLRCQDPNCKSCDSFGQCTQCMNGYVLDGNNICSKCTIQYAASCSSSSQVNSCIKGFTKSDDGKSCTPVDTLCQFGQYADNMICTDCPVKCKQCDSKGKCYICEGNYYITSAGICQICPSQCNSCVEDSQGAIQCNSCIQGYFLQQIQGTWGCTKIEDSNYIQCPVGQYTNKSTNTCLACERNCLECSQFGDSCNKCFDQINYEIVNGKCQLRCSGQNQYQKYESPNAQKDDTSQKQKSLFFFNSPLILMSDETIQNKCMSECAIQNCQQCIFDTQFCQLCSSNYFLQLDGTCVKQCPDGTFSQKVGSVSKCLPCARGCTKCSSKYSCSQCSNEFILISNSCLNEDITNSPDSNKVFFDELWMQRCPFNTFKIANICLPSKTCKIARFLMNGRVVNCIQCMSPDKIQIEDSNGGYSSSISLPDLKEKWFGKCYEDCPALTDKQKNNKICKNECDSTLPFLDWSKDNSCSSKCGQNLQSKLQQKCNTLSLCLAKQYFDLDSLLQDGILLDPNNIPTKYCKACPNGCEQCFYNGQKNPTCLSCSVGFETYITFNYQNPMDYTLPDPSQANQSNNWPQFKNANTQCIQTQAGQKQCSKMQGYFADKNEIFLKDACIMCQYVNTSSGCDSCPASSLKLFLDQNQYQCVPYCDNNQLKSKDGLNCFKKPQISLSANFNNKIDIQSQSFNIPNGSASLNLKVNLTALYKLKLNSATCSISLQSFSGMSFQISPTPNQVFNQQVSHTFNLADPSQNMIKLNKYSKYKISCTFQFEIEGLPSQTFEMDQSINVETLSLPTGSVDVSQKSDDSSTTYTVIIDQWSFQPLKTFKEYNQFEYTINILAKNTKNLNIPVYIYNIDYIKEATYPDKFKITTSGFQKFNYSFTINIQNKNYNSFNLQLIATPTNPQLKHLVSTVTLPLNYSYSEPNTTRKPQTQVINQVLNQKINGDNNKPNLTQIQQVANLVQFYRGDLPTNQEVQTNLTFNKQSKLNQKYYIPIECDSKVHCSGNGKCKTIKNSNWYSMCICNQGYKGEQCNWTTSDWKEAKQMAKQYIQILNDSIQNLDSNGENKQGLNVTQIITLLQFWTDQRDLIKENTFQNLMNIFKTNTLMKFQVDKNSQRIQYILDNLIDIVRMENIPDFQSKQYFEQIIQQVQALNLQVMNQITDSSNPQVVIDRSNYKGILVHNNQFQKLSSNSLSLAMPNNMQFSIPKTMVKSNQYLEILMKPMDLAFTTQNTCQEGCKYRKDLMTNQIVINVKDLTSGNDIDVKNILTVSPLVFNITFDIPSLYLSQIQNITCVYWDADQQDWLADGVKVLQKFYSHNVLQSIQCSTQHLTEFAVISNSTFNDSQPTDIASNPFEFDTSFKLQEFISLCILFVASLLFYIISLFSKTYASDLFFGQSDQKKSDFKISGIIPELVFSSDVIEDYEDEDARTRSNIEEQDKKDIFDEKKNRFITNKLSQVVPINKNNQISDEKNSNTYKVVQSSDLNRKNATEQIQMINMQTLQEGNSTNPASQQPLKKQNDVKLISKIQYLNGIPATPINKESDNQVQIIQNENFTSSLQSKHKQHQTIQSSNFLKELNYPQEYQRPQNQLIIQNQPTLFHQNDDKNMDYVYNNKRIRKNIPTILEESATGSDSLNQKSQNIKVPAIQNIPSQLIQSNIQRFSEQNLGENQMRVLDLETKSNTNSGDPMVNQNQHEVNSETPSNPHFSPLLIDNPPAFQNTNKRRNYDIKPYLTIFCWRYNFKNCSSSQRVLYCVTLLALYIFSSSFYFQYFSLVQYKSNYMKYILLQSTIIWATFEIINWILITIIQIKRIFSSFIRCFDNSIKIQILLKFTYFLLAFGLLLFSSALIYFKHQNKSRQIFFDWILTFGISCIVNIILEYILMKLICRFRLRFLFLIIKTKRLDL